MDFQEALEKKDINILDIWKEQQENDNQSQETENWSDTQSDSQDESNYVFCDDRYGVIIYNTLQKIYNIVECEEIYILEWLFKNIKYIIVYYAKQIQNCAYQEGKVKVLEWCKERKIDYCEESVAIAGYCKKVDVLCWWEENKDWTKERYNQQKIIDNAVFGQNKKVLEWWIEYELRNNRKIVFGKTAMRVLCQNSRCLLEWCIENKEKIRFDYDKQAINMLCKYGCQKELKLWYNNRDALWMIYDEEAIQLMCEFGELNTLNWWINSGLELKYDKNNEKVKEYLNIIEQNKYIKSENKIDICQICHEELYKKIVYECKRCKKEYHKRCHKKLKQRKIRKCPNCKDIFFNDEVYYRIIL